VQHFGDDWSGNGPLLPVLGMILMQKKKKLEILFRSKKDCVSLQKE